MSVIFMSLMVFLVLICLAFIFMPILKEQTDFRKMMGFPLSIALFVIIFSITWYWLAGRSAHIIYAKEDASLQQIAVLLEDVMSLPQPARDKILEELHRQENRASAQPTVWILQAQLAMQQGHYTEAKQAYYKAHQEYSDDIDISVSYAQAWYLSDNQNVSPQLADFLKNLEAQDPEQTGLINLLAVIAFHQQDYNKAIRYWNELIPQYPENSSEAITINAAIVTAQKELENKK